VQGLIASLPEQKETLRRLFFLDEAFPVDAKLVANIEAPFLNFLQTRSRLHLAFSLALSVA
jgi:hypothetical protein